MIPCDCNNRLEVFSVVNGEEKGFVEGFDLLKPEDSEHWFELYRCCQCETTWCFENDGRTNLAVRIANEAAYNTFKMEPIYDNYLKEQLILECGGLSEDKCQWKGCKQEAVRGCAFCPHHYLDLDRDFDRNVDPNYT